MTEYSVVDLEARQTYPLRFTVLRSDTPSTVVAFDEDDWPGTFHLGVRELGDVADIVAVSTWIPKPYDQESAVQLRGMATAPHVQGHGVGGLLVEFGCRRAATVAPLVWARARDTALGFYVRHGFTIHGDGFIDDSTGKPHHLIVRRLTQP